MVRACVDSRSVITEPGSIRGDLGKVEAYEIRGGVLDLLRRDFPAEPGSEAGQVLLAGLAAGFLEHEVGLGGDRHLDVIEIAGALQEIRRLLELLPEVGVA